MTRQMPDDPGTNLASGCYGEEANLHQNYIDCGRRNSGSIIAAYSGVSVVRVETKSLISAPTGVLWQIMMEVDKYPQWYSAILEASGITSAGGQIEVPRKGNGRVHDAIVVYRHCCRVCAPAKARLDRWDVSDFDGPTFF
jgi:hypothetical protein